MKSKLRFGLSAVCASEAAQKRKVPASSGQMNLFARLDFEVMFLSGSADQFAAGRVGRFPPVFCPDNLAHEFGRELGVLVGEFNPDRFAIHQRQLMAKFV